MDLRDASQNFFLIEGVIYQYANVLGEGADGLVVLAKSIIDSALIAIKMPDSHASVYPRIKIGFFAAVNKEARLLRKKGDLIGVCHEDKSGFDDAHNSFIGMRYIPGTPLSHHMASKKDLWGYQQYSTIVRRLSKNIEELHNIGITHQDLHPGNVLVLSVDANDLPSEFEIIDFGRSQEIPPGGSVETVKLIMNDFYDIVDYGIRRLLSDICLEGDAYLKFTDVVNNIMHLRRDILHPERPVVSGLPVVRPLNTHLDRDIIRDITSIAHGIIEGIPPRLNHKFSQIWKKLTEEDEFEVIVLRSQVTGPSHGHELFAKFLVDGRTIADARLEKPGPERIASIAWGPGVFREADES